MAMSRPVSSCAALPIAYAALRLLIVLNWLGGAAILALLLVMPNEQWIMSALKLSSAPEGERLVMGLRAIAWTLLTLQVLSMVIGAIGKFVSTPAHRVDLDAGFSINGWLAVLLTFLLAQVFAEGALM